MDEGQISLIANESGMESGFVEETRRLVSAAVFVVAADADTYLLCIC